MDAAQAAVEKRQRERDSVARQRAAGQSPRQSTGGGGWERRGYHPLPSEPLDAAAPTSSTADEMGGAKDTGGPPKVYGVNEP